MGLAEGEADGAVGKFLVPSFLLLGIPKSWAPLQWLEVLSLFERK